VIFLVGCMDAYRPGALEIPAFTMPGQLYLSATGGSQGFQADASLALAPYLSLHSEFQLQPGSLGVDYQQGSVALGSWGAWGRVRGGARLGMGLGSWLEPELEHPFLRYYGQLDGGIAWEHAELLGAVRWVGQQTVVVLGEKEWGNWVDVGVEFRVGPGKIWFISQLWVSSAGQPGTATGVAFRF
jgi:hypothetical protein